MQKHNRIRCGPTLTTVLLRAHCRCRQEMESPLLYFCRESLQENPLSSPSLLLSCRNGLAAASRGHRGVSAATRVSEVLKYDVRSHRRPPREEGAPTFIFGLQYIRADQNSIPIIQGLDAFQRATSAVLLPSLSISKLNSYAVRVWGLGGGQGAGQKARGRGPEQGRGQKASSAQLQVAHTLHWLCVVLPGLARLQHSTLRTFLSWEIS